MKKLSKNEFGVTSKHDLWNRIKELEDQLRSKDLSLICVSGDFDDLNQELTDAKKLCECLKQEVQKLKRHNDYLLTLLSSYPQSSTIKFN